MKLLLARLRVIKEFEQQAIVAGYIVDFYHPGLRRGSTIQPLAIEVDGSSHFTREGQEWDARRDAALSAQGIRTYRVTNARIVREPRAVEAEILALLTAGGSGGHSGGTVGGGS